MEIKATLNKPYDDKQRADFIVEYNHNLGYEIQETDEALLAIQPDPYVPTDEEQRQNRERAYAAEIDQITAHIQRLRDENPIPEGEIAELIAEREAKVREIKERFPYSEVKDDVI